jgi:hypothetical protein
MYQDIIFANCKTDKAGNISKKKMLGARGRQQVLSSHICYLLEVASRQL